MATPKPGRRGNKNNPIQNPPLDEGQGQEEDSKEPEKPKGNGAQVHLQVRGDARSAREAMDEMAAGRGAVEVAEQPAEEDDDLDPVSEYMASPKCMVIVKRQTPTSWQGMSIETNIELARYGCPMDLDTVKRETFQRFGGHSFVVTVHPNTPNGASKILGGTTIVNVNAREPLDEGVPIGEPEPETPGGTGLNPTEQLDPLAMAEEAVTRRIQLQNRKRELKEANRTMKELDADDAEPKAPSGLSAEQLRIAELEKKLSEQSLEGRLNSKIDELKAAITAQKAAAPPPAAPDNMALIIKLIESSDTRTATMIKTMTENTDKILDRMSRGGEKTDEDKIIDRLMKYKNLFGPSEKDDGGGHRLSKIENTLIDMAMNQFGVGKGEPGDDDPIKYAVKELSPILKTYVEKKMENDKVKADDLTQEQKKAIYFEAAKTAARDIARKMIEEGKLVPIGSTNQTLPAPVQPSPVKPAASPAVPPPAPATQPTPQPQETSMDVPPSPQSPAYDRKKAVDFVLDVALGDIKKGVREESFLMGDMLDRLDDEILNGIMNLETGDQLRALLAPYATPGKLEAVEEAGNKDPDVKRWLKNCIVTVQNMYADELKKSQPQQ